MTPTLYLKSGEEVTLPHKNMVCPSCRGEGHTSAFNIGVITADDWNNDWDEEAQDDYLAGNYDEICPTCRGNKVVKVVDRARIPAATLSEWDAQETELAECAAIQRAEMLAGA